MPSLRSLLSAGALIFAGAFVFQACGKQSEGERCETTNGNNDCDPGLECVSRQTVNDTICCPKDGVAPTTAECAGAATTPSDAGGTDTAKAETGAPADTGVADTAADSGSETAADTATDPAPADAADAG